MPILSRFSTVGLCHPYSGEKRELNIKKNHPKNSCESTVNLQALGIAPNA